MYKVNRNFYRHPTRRMCNLLACSIGLIEVLLSKVTVTGPMVQLAFRRPGAMGLEKVEAQMVVSY
jgi:hypothetical protein